MKSEFLLLLCSSHLPLHVSPQSPFSSISPSLSLSLSLSFSLSLSLSLSLFLSFSFSLYAPARAPTLRHLTRGWTQIDACARILTRDSDVTHSYIRIDISILFSHTDISDILPHTHTHLYTHTNTQLHVGGLEKTSVGEVLTETERAILKAAELELGVCVCVCVCVCDVGG